MKRIMFLLMLSLLLLSACRGTVHVDCYANEDCCGSEDSCRYYSYAGECHTSEYVEKILSKCQDGTGPCPKEAMDAPKTAECSCVDTKCVVV